MKICGHCISALCSFPSAQRQLNFTASSLPESKLLQNAQDKTGKCRVKQNARREPDIPFQPNSSTYCNQGPDQFPVTISLSLLTRSTLAISRMYLCQASPGDCYFQILFSNGWPHTSRTLVPISGKSPQKAHLYVSQRYSSQWGAIDPSALHTNSKRIPSLAYWLLPSHIYLRAH